MMSAGQIRFRSVVAFFLLIAIDVAAEDRPAQTDFSLRTTNIPIQQINIDGVTSRDVLGYPRIDWPKFQTQKPDVVERLHRAVVLENCYVRITVLPEMGRVYSLFSKITSHEQLWINKIAKPIPALNDTGWWMVWGGIEYTLPRGEHGTIWALPWKYEVSENSARRKALKMTVLEPVTKLEETIEISIEPDRAFFEANITITNIGDREAKFAHWINPMWAPGGRGEITPETEFVVPCTAMVVLDRDFNRWMLGDKIQEFERNPLRFVKHWRDIGDLLSQQLTAGFYGAFAHDANEGVVRVFDPIDTPGVDIWTWGFLPPPARQLGYTEVPNLGYVEMWGGTAHDFSDDSRGILAPKATKQWKEKMFAFGNIGGLTDANQDVAINFKFEADKKTIELGIFPTTTFDSLVIDLRCGDWRLLQRTENLSPQTPFYARIPVPDNSKLFLLPELTLKHGGQTLVAVRAKPRLPLRWNSPYLPEKPAATNP